MKQSWLRPPGSARSSLLPSSPFYLLSQEARAASDETFGGRIQSPFSWRERTFSSSLPPSPPHPPGNLSSAEGEGPASASYHFLPLLLWVPCTWENIQEANAVGAKQETGPISVNSINNSTNSPVVCQVLEDEALVGSCFIVWCPSLPCTGGKPGALCSFICKETNGQREKRSLLGSFSPNS